MIDQIRKYYWARPFVPFTMHLADGRALTVTHPESMAQGPDGRTVAVWQPDGAFHLVNTLLVTDVSLTPQAAVAAS